MAFIRTVKRENPFVQLDKTFFEDENLQWESKGLLGYILSRPDNWKINQTDLTKRSAGGKAKVEAALLDLLSNGYINWYMIRNEDGTFQGWFYDVYERPEFNPNKDECIAEGKRRIAEKKAKTKLKNDKKKEKQPESDYPKQAPKPDNPKQENPTSDNPSYTNNDFNDIDFNNISSSSDSKNSIDDQLKEKYPNAPFEEIKTELLNDDTATINTDKQYKSMLEYRLKNWKPKKPNAHKQTKGKKPIRTEVLPDWFDNPNEEKAPSVDPEAKKQEIDEMLKKLREEK